MGRLSAVLVILSTLSTSLQAQSSPPVQAGSALVVANPLLVLLGLLAVVGLIFALAWLLRRVGVAGAYGGQAIKVLAAVNVGSREKVLLVDVGGKQLLLGVAPGRVSSLCEFAQPVVNADLPVTDDFRARFKQVLQRQERSDHEQ